MEAFRQESAPRISAKVSTGQLLNLLRPDGAYARPNDVLQDEDLTLYEKRAILASWASDACAVESEPALRAPSSLSSPVTYDEIIEALRSLDEELQRRCLLME